MASSGPSALLQERSPAQDDSACASAAGHKDAGAASSIVNWESPKPSTSRGGSASITSNLPSASAPPNDVVYDLISVEQTASEDSPAKLSMSEEDSSMRVSNDSLLADLGITNMDSLLPGQYESDSTDTPLISLSPYKVAASMDLCDSDKCSSSDNNVRDLESLLKEAGIEEIKDEVVIVSKTSSGLDMIQVMEEEMTTDQVLSDGKVLTVKADIECIPSNSALLADTPQDTPEHQPACTNTNTNKMNSVSSLTSQEDDNLAQTKPCPPQDNHKKSNGVTKKDTKQQPKGKKPKLQKQLKFSVDEEDADVKNHRELKILPRTTQYERHPLLQVRTESGVSAIEALLMEHEENMRKSDRLKKHKSLSIEDDKLHQKRHNFEANRRKSVETYSAQNKIVPRTAQYECHPLLEKTESGLSELEQYLKEKEEECLRQDHLKRHSDGSIPEGHSKVTRKVSFPNVPERRPSLGVLLPRTAQYEKHPLLQSRDDETGLSEIEKFLHEKHMATTHEEDEQTDQKKEKPLANDANNKVAHDSNEMSTLLPEDQNNQECRPRTASTKRVHFEKAGKGTSEEIEELGSVQINADEKSAPGKGQENTKAVDKAKKSERPDTKDANKCCVIL